MQMDRRLWLIVGLAVILLCAASAIMGVQSEYLANRLWSLQEQSRAPEMSRNHLVLTTQSPDTAQARNPAPHARTVAPPDQVALAGF